MAVLAIWNSTVGNLRLLMWSCVEGKVGYVLRKALLFGFEGQWKKGRLKRS